MSLDQSVTTTMSTDSVRPAIENELPAYRAINPHAVLSAIVGLLAIFSFTNWFFLAFAVGAIALGLYADRQIRRYPEIWTGQKLAQVGTALGLIFGLSAVTNSFAQDFLRKRAATSFVKHYVKMLKDGSFEDLFWYSMPPEVREGRAPADLAKDFKKQMREPGMWEMKYGTLEKIKSLLATQGEDVHFIRIEQHGTEGLTGFATALLDVHGPGNKEFPQKELSALVLVRGSEHKGKTHWVVSEVMFPYTPKSYVHAAKPPDDGHGHSH